MQPAWSLFSEEKIPILADTDAALARNRARSVAALTGFSRRAQWEIAIAVSEAATNIVKFAGRGLITFRRIEGQRPGLEFEALDHGPGIADIERALQDGYSEGRFITPDDFSIRFRGLGSGLPAIRRMMHELSIGSAEGGGTILTARKYL